MTREHDLAAIGAGMLDAGYATTDVGRVVRDIAARDGGAVVGVLPAAVIVDSGAALRPAILPTSGALLTFAQVGRIGRLAADAQAGALVAVAAQRIASEAAGPVRHPWWRAAVGGALMSGGIAVVFGLPWWAIGIDALLGAVVGVTLLATGRVPGIAAVVPFVAALVSAVVVGAVAIATGQEVLPVFAVCAPIVMLIPGATVTNAVLEIGGGDMVSGGGRLLSGLLIWSTLAAGVVVGVLVLQRFDAIQLSASAADPVPPWLVWPAVVVLAAGVAVFFAAPPVMTATIMVVLLVAYALTAVLTPPTGSAVATAITAAAVLIGVRVLERFRPELPAIATFRPAFWLLVPGSLGLASIARGDATGLVAVAATVLAIVLGVLVGSVASASLPRR